MLILSRKPGESLHIGDDIKITVISVQGKQVRLGIVLPAAMAVYREEVYVRIEEENKQAALASNNDLLAVADLWRGTKK